MSRPTRILYVLLAAVSGGWSVAALGGGEGISQSWTSLGITEQAVTFLALLGLVGAAGLLAGMRWPAPGLAASSALTPLLIASLVLHVRARDVVGTHASVIAAVLAMSATASALTDVRGRPAARGEAGAKTASPPLLPLPRLASSVPTERTHHRIAAVRHDP